MYRVTVWFEKVMPELCSLSGCVTLSAEAVASTVNDALKFVKSQYSLGGIQSVLIEPFEDGE